MSDYSNLLGKKICIPKYGTVTVVAFNDADKGYWPWGESWWTERERAAFTKFGGVHDNGAASDEIVGVVRTERKNGTRVYYYATRYVNSLGEEGRNDLKTPVVGDGEEIPLEPAELAKRAPEPKRDQPECDEDQTRMNFSTGKAERIFAKGDAPKKARFVKPV